MVLADLGRKITVALHSLSKATVINEEVNKKNIYGLFDFNNKLLLSLQGDEFNAERSVYCTPGS